MLYDSECAGCHFLSGEVCGFMLHTGRSRMLICGTGKDCTVKARTNAEKEALHAKYGRTVFSLESEIGRDAAIALAMASKNRRNAALGKAQRFDQRKAWELYENERLSDGEIAKRLGVHRNTIVFWRKRNNYPPNYSYAGKVQNRATVKPPKGR